MVGLWPIGTMLSGAGGRYPRALCAPDSVVVATPSLDQDLGLVQRVEDLTVQMAYRGFAPGPAGDLLSGRY